MSPQESESDAPEKKFKESAKSVKLNLIKNNNLERVG